MMPLLRMKHDKTFQQLLGEQAPIFRDEAERIPPGTARDFLLQRASKAEAAAHLDKWLSSPGLRPPK